MSLPPDLDDLGRRRRRLYRLLIPLGLCFIAQGIGIALAPVLLQRSPVLLLILAPLLRHLVLASPSLDTVPFFLLGVAGMFLIDPFCYGLGRQYGKSAVQWVERRAGAAASSIRWIERLFRRAAPVVLFVSPGPFVNLLAGASGMSVPLWLSVNLAGTFTSVLLIRLFGEALAGPIGVVREFVEANVILLTVLSIAVVAASVMLRRRRLRRAAAASVVVTNVEPSPLTPTTRD